jgi:ankyrin repeat protein
VKLLIGHGSDINAADNNGRIALTFAKDRGFTDIVNLLFNSSPEDYLPAL